MKEDSLEIELKLQLIDELADVLHVHQQEGAATAKAAFRRVVDTYPEQYQDARVLLAIAAIETFIKNPAETNILDIAEFLGETEVAIAGTEVAV
jgi:hypothetical protein